MTKKLAVLFPFLLYACQTTQQQTSVAKTSQATAQNLKSATYTKVFRELPLAASLTKLPWPSDAWTTVHGGAGFRWQLAQEEQLEDLDDLQPYVQYEVGAPLDLAKLSPIEKMDVYLGNTNWDLTREERARTLGQKMADGSPRVEIPEWEGIMHAWSAASLQFDPVGPVSLKAKNGQTVTFEKQDIYSLLSLFVHQQSPRATVLAAVCPGSEVGAAAGPYAFENEKQNLRARKCGKLDAATFHTVLGNQIGKLNEGFVMDRDDNGEILNNPVVAYESRIIETPGAVVKAGQARTIKVRTVVFLTAELPVNLMDQEDEAYPYETEAYEYELKIDGSGKIVSGEWLNEKGTDANIAIPDFLWKSAPVWLNGEIKKIYDQGRKTFAEQRGNKQLRPIEDMPLPERQTLNGYFNARDGESVRF